MVSGADADFGHVSVHHHGATCLKDMPCPRLMREQNTRGKWKLCSPFVEKEKNNCFWHIFTYQRPRVFCQVVAPGGEAISSVLWMELPCVWGCFSLIYFHIPLLCLTNKKCWPSVCDCSLYVVSLILYTTGCVYGCDCIIVLTFNTGPLFLSTPLMYPNGECSNHFTVLIFELVDRWVFSPRPLGYLETSAGFKWTQWMEHVVISILI